MYEQGHKGVKEEITLLAESCIGGHFREMSYTLWVGSMIPVLKREAV